MINYSKIFIIYFIYWLLFYMFQNIKYYYISYLSFFIKIHMQNIKNLYVYINLYIILY